MKTFAFSLLAGCLVGVVYGLLKVRSPAPPVVALVGLLGILIGEQLVNMLRTAVTPPVPHHADAGYRAPAAPQAAPRPAEKSPPDPGQTL